MYSRACIGFQAVLGPSSNQCQCLERSIASLDLTQGKQKEILIDVDMYRPIYYNGVIMIVGSKDVTANIALDHNEKRKSPSVVRRLIRKLFEFLIYSAAEDMTTT
jgi:hypothetical protein